jgi:hypothetical protein
MEDMDLADECDEFRKLLPDGWYLAAVLSRDGKFLIMLHTLATGELLQGVGATPREAFQAAFVLIERTIH